MTHAQKARTLFCNGCNCAQAVFAAFAEDFGIEESQALKLASSFGGGMGGMRDTCGAVTGMLMVAGLKWGYDDVKDQETKTAHYARTRMLIEQFKQVHTTYVCRELLSALEKLQADPSPRTPEYYRVRPCARFVETAAQLLDDMAAQEE